MCRVYNTRCLYWCHVRQAKTSAFVAAAAADDDDDANCILWLNVIEII